MSSLDLKTLVNISAAAAKHRHELPVTYRPSVRDVCETSYSMGAKEFYPIGFEAGMKAGRDDAIENAKLAMAELLQTVQYPSLRQIVNKLEALKTMYETDIKK